MTLLDDRTFDDKLAGAFARNGLNTLLLDIKEDIGGVREKVDGIGSRLAVIEPTLWKLEEERQRKIGLSQGIKKFVTIGRAAWIAAGGLIVWLGQHVPGWFKS